MSTINPIRFGGIASGLDTESIVKQLMQLERTKVDRTLQQKTTQEWKRDDYRAINTKLLNLRNASFDMRLQGTFMSRKVESSDDSVLTATASTSAVEGTYNIKVHQLASGVSVNSSEALGSAETKTTLADQFAGIADEVSFTLKGEKGEQSFTFATTGDNAKNIYDVVNEINKADLGVRANYDATLDRFFLMSSGTGSKATVSVTADSAGEGKGFISDYLKMGTVEHRGNNAIIDFNSIENIEYASNSFTVNGINLNLKDDSEDIIKITVSNDIDTVVDKFKDFVEKYNAVMEDINTKLGEKRYRDFTPLTDEKKDGMNEKDIERWEEKARSGLFRGDSLLSTAVSNIRMAAMDAVKGLNGSYKSLSAIGITTSPNWNDQGKLYINEDKLRSALSDDAEGVMALFTQEEEKDAAGNVVKGQGIARSLYDNLNSSINNIRDKAGSAASSVDQSFMGKEISRTDKMIDDLQERLLRVEDRYWKQFTAMEKALQQMQSQSDWLMAQLGTGQ